MFQLKQENCYCSLLHPIWLYNFEVQTVRKLYYLRWPRFWLHFQTGQSETHMAPHITRLFPAMTVIPAFKALYNELEMQDIWFTTIPRSHNVATGFHESPIFRNLSIYLYSPFGNYKNLSLIIRPLGMDGDVTIIRSEKTNMFNFVIATMLSSR